MASSSLSSLSSILSNPHGCSLCFKASTQRCFALRFLSSKATHASSSSSSALLPRCRSSTHRLTQKPINRKKGFSLNLSRSFSISQIASSGKFDGPSLHQFVSNAQAHASLTTPETESESTLDSDIASKGRIYHETYGCQMNINDMEIVLAIMKNSGYKEVVTDPESAEVIFVNTCAIRENAEQRVWQRLNYFWFLKREWKVNAATGRAKSLKPPKVVVLGCMAERLKDKILDSDKMVDVVCGPDAYRDLPRLLEEVDYGQKGINTLLSLEETYADISPVRISENSITAFVSVMRGCNNMCAFCIVPFTRGRERSRPVESIIREVGELWESGVKEVTLLGQNVNSYNDDSADRESGANWEYSEGFSSRCKVKNMGLRFADLLDRLSVEFPEMRFRFTSPHPKDYPDELLYLMRDRHNICNLIHLPAQSGNSRILEQMRRGYTREAYLDLVKKIRSIIPDVAITSDFITGFCGESEEEHQETLSLVRAVGYDMAYMFAYSMREKTHAHRNYTDDVPEEVKQRRLTELIDAFRETTGPCYDSQPSITSQSHQQALQLNNTLSSQASNTKLKTSIKMRASFTAIVTGLMAFNVAALPGGTPYTWGSGAPGGTPSCAGSKYTCKSNSLLSVLTCTNILNGVGVSIPIILLKERDVEARTSNQDGDYCCTSNGLLSLSCLNVGNGLTITVPIIA